MEQTNKEKVLIRLIKDISKFQLSTSDLEFIKNNIDRIYIENKVQEQILKYINNRHYIKDPVRPRSFPPE